MFLYPTSWSVRKWKLPKVGTQSESKDWEFEIGEPPKSFNPNSDLLVESSLNPIFIKQDSKDAFVWRIRQLPHPKEVYQLSIKDDGTAIVVRTSNKKYYKMFDVPEMARLRLRLDAKNLSWDYAHNTLIIRYLKPTEIIQQEEAERQERSKLFKNAMTLA
eukprot:TRINITY_DN1767_c0_g1_i1.p1 TRINITY_DN1767_c0_g1~~TRINITY_DN1767_c0_g1_i1.p1  ORF type:complete len:160 (+),score=30.41 TRINITY_DN1767_c0_g1_i1:133-612(+)